MRRRAALLLLLLLLTAAAILSCRDSAPVPAPLVLSSGDPVTIVCSEDGAAADAVSEIRTHLTQLGCNVSVVQDDSSAEGGILLLGRTEHTLSAELEALVQAETPPGGTGWGFLVRNSVLAVYASEKEGYTNVMNQLFEEFTTDQTMILPDGTARTGALSAEEWEALTQERRECARLRAAIRAQAAHEPAITALESPYAAPPVVPVRAQHPRVLLTRDSIPGIRTALTSDEGHAAATEFANLAAQEITGLLPALQGDAPTHNYDGRLLGVIEAKGLAYLLTGRELYGYQAIYALNNYIETLDIRRLNDKYRAYGHTMFTAAEIYDWCHDLMTDEDRASLVSAVEHRLCRDGKMEIGFPPMQQSPISSHGSEAQLLRDYMAFAIAVYDEYPDWWEYTGGRFYEEYVPFRNEYMQSGLSPQGVGLYGPYRHNFDLWAAFLVQTMSGEMPFTGSIRQVLPSFLAAELPQDKEVFPDGDYYGQNLGLIELGDAQADTSNGELYSVCTAMLHSALFGNETSRAAAKYYSRDFTRFIHTRTTSLRQANT